MKLKVITYDIDLLKKSLTFMLTLRKLCVLRFTKENLQIISSTVNEPQIWCKLSETIFQSYDIEATRNNSIALEINIEPLLQVLKNFETAGESLMIRLERRPTADGAAKQNNPTKNKAAASLALYYSEYINHTISIKHYFNIPVRLLKAESDDRIIEPEIENMHVALQMPNELLMLFKRIERYKTSDTLLVSVNKLGYLKFIIEEEERKIEIQWKDKLQTSGDMQDSQNSQPKDEENEVEMLKQVVVKLKLKFWNIGSKLLNLSPLLAMTFVVHDNGCVLHCYLDDGQTSQITFFINKISSVEI